MAFIKIYLLLLEQFDFRSNLDPFNKCDDDFLWDVLKKTRLLAKVKSMPNQMSTYVGDGENLSVGEKQLVCLARTLARGSKVRQKDKCCLQEVKEGFF